MHSTRSASDKVYQLLANGRWFSPGTPASSTTKIGHHDIDEILLKVTLSTINKSINITQQLKHLITMNKLFCRMYSHYLHKKLGQSYYPTAEDFDYHVRQSIEMFNNCSRRQGLRACLYDSDLYKKMRVGSPLLYGFDNHHLFLYLCCDLVCFVFLFCFFHLFCLRPESCVPNIANVSGFKWQSTVLSTILPLFMCIAKNNTCTVYINCCTCSQPKYA